MQTIRTLSVVAVLSVVAAGVGSCSSSGSSGSSASPSSSTSASSDVLQSAMQELVSTQHGPPGVLTLVAKGDASPTVTTAGVNDVSLHTPITSADITRIASVAKAFSGAAALSLVRDGKLSVNSTVAQSVKGLPKAWGAVTIAQLLQHTGGVPDYIKSPAFLKKFVADPTYTWKPRQLLKFVESKPLEFTPGTQYAYSDSDNIIIGLIVEQATGKPYAEALIDLVYQPVELASTSLPDTPPMPNPHVNGYSYDEAGAQENVTESVSPSGAWASGGILSNATDLNLFVRAYVSGQLIGQAQHEEQFNFVAGESGPPGPGTNSSGLAVYRYETECGTYYGHTGNFPGYTTFIASTEDGQNSTVVIVNSQINPRSENDMYSKLKKVYEAAVCQLKS